MQEFALQPVLPPLIARPEQVERALKVRFQDAMNILKPRGRELDLLIVILPDNNGSLYGTFYSATRAFVFLFALSIVHVQQ